MGLAAHPGRAALALGAIVGLGLAAGGCASGDKRELHVYFVDCFRTTPTTARATTADAVRGAQLALADSHGRAGRFKVRLIPLDISRPDLEVDLKRAASYAHRAARDPRAVAYIDACSSEAAATALPVTNRAGLLHVGAEASYPGLTRREGGRPGDPAGFYPTGRRTFGRVLLTDDVDAAAVAAYMRRERVHRAVAIPAGFSLSSPAAVAAFARAAPRAGIRLVGGAELFRGIGPSDARELARRVAATGAEALFFAGCPTAKEASEFAESAPRIKIFLGGCNTTRRIVDDPELTTSYYAVGPAMTIGDTRLRRRFTERFRDVYGVTGERTSPLIDYEAMALVLDCIRRAGPDGDKRAALVRRLFTTRNRRSVIGTYSIDRNGDPTLPAYGLYRVEPHRLVSTGLFRVRD